MNDASPTAAVRQEPWQNLEKLLSRRGEVCGGLMELCGQQNTLIEAEEPVDRLMAVLGRKQVLIDQLQGIEQELAPLKGLWRRERDSVESTQRKRISELAERAEKALKQVLELEEVGRSRLMESRGRVVQELTHLDKGRRLAKAYGNPGQAEARAIDRHT